MRLVTNIALGLLCASAMAQIPDGATARKIFQNDKQIARAIEVHRIVQLGGQDTRYYASRSVPVPGYPGVPSEIRSWSTLDGRPIKSIYSAQGFRVEATFGRDTVVFVADIGSKRTTTTLELPKDKPVVMAQFDPSLVLNVDGSKAAHCAVVDPQNQTIVECDVRYLGEATITRGNAVETGSRFSFETSGGRAIITLDANGEFVRFKGSNGMLMVRDKYRRDDEEILNNLL